MFKKFKERLSGVEEVIDDFHLEGNELIQNLEEIEGYNKMLGGYDALLSALNLTMFTLRKEKKHSLLDLGCGGADTLKRVAEVSKNKGFKLCAIGVDANPFIVEYARDQTKNYEEVEIRIGDVMQHDFLDKNYDFLSANIFLHHFSEEEIVTFLKRAIEKTNKAIIICDLHRNIISYYSFIAIVRLFGANRITLNDGKISILKGFLKKEWEAILEKAGAKKYQIKWKWAFRHQIIVYCQ